MSHLCKAVGCNQPSHPGRDFCRFCDPAMKYAVNDSQQSMADKYPQYYKSVGELKEIDVYAVHQLFNIQDPSGAIQHASKKLLLSGARTGGKSALKDITEARDTLTRWIQLQTNTP
jgi:chemotaxis response regulator CheB